MKFVSVAVLAALCVLGACSSRDSLDGRGPDEYMTTSNPPLVLPPDFALRAPVDEKTVATQTTPAQKQVEKTLNAPEKTKNVSAGEQALLQKTGTGDPDIRAEMQQDEMTDDENTPVLDKALKTDKAQTTVKPEKEAADLQAKGVKTTGEKATKATAK